LRKNILYVGKKLEAHMRASIRCPSSGEAVTFEVMTDARTVAESWKKFIRLKCPHCEDRHAIPFKEVYIDGVLASFTPEHTGMFQMLAAPPKPGRKQEGASSVVAPT
jgi:hypothetical protein